MMLIIFIMPSFMFFFIFFSMIYRDSNAGTLYLKFQRLSLYPLNYGNPIAIQNKEYISEHSISLIVFMPH